MEIAHLREFAYLAETLSFKRTADYFYISRSVVSRHLAALEEAIGADLVNRQGNSISLTEAGKSFYRDVLVLLRDYETALEHVRIAQAGKTSIVRVGYLRNVARPIIARFVRRMRHDRKDIQVTLACLEFNELRSALEDGTVDIALAVEVNPKFSRNYRKTPLYTSQFYALMSKDNPLATHTNGITVADLSADKLLLPDSFIRSGYSNVSENLEERMTLGENRDTFFDVDMLYMKVQTQDYVAFATKENSAIFGEDLVSLPLLDVDTEFRVSAFYRNGFTGESYEACKAALETCRDTVA